MTSEYKTRVPPFHAGNRFADGDGGLTQSGADALNLLRRRTGGSDDLISEQQVIAIAQQQDNALVSPDGAVGAFFFALSERLDNLETRLAVATGEEALENGVGELSSHQVDQIKNIDPTQNIGTPNWEITSNLNQELTTGDAVVFTSVNGVPLGLETGWTAGTGTQTKGGMNSDNSNAPSATYQQVEVSAINTDVVETRRVVQAIQALLTTLKLAGP
ncbi:MAG: hypothetical protein KAV87_48285 [Desulfobacteraceae bacterium]|nr:hypothetical protein [Desulfobacteraceae bacterium]